LGSTRGPGIVRQLAMADAMKLLDILPNGLLAISALAILSMIFFVWGMLTVKHQIFPFQLLNFCFRESRNSKMILAKARGFDLFSHHVDVVFIGDSITEAAQWHEMFPTIKVANRGIAGDTTVGIQARMDGIVATAPKKAFIMVGFNDFNDGNEVSRVFSRYCDIVQKLEEAQTTVVIQSTIDCCARRRRVYSKIRLLNTKLQQFATTSGHLWIDLNERLASPKSGLNPAYSYDGVHLNGDGYQQWRDLIADAVLDGLDEKNDCGSLATDDRGHVLAGLQPPVNSKHPAMAESSS